MGLTPGRNVLIFKMDELRAENMMDKKSMMTKTTMVAAALVMALGMAGCGDKEKASSPSQVLAKVNGKEITVLQLNYLLAQNQRLDKAQQQSKQKLLDDLIQQELLVQKAEELKLDRNPNVLQAVEFAKRQVLAQAVAGQVLGKVKDPADSEIKKFYDAHPLVFADRKFYNLSVFVIKADALNPAVGEQLNKSTNGDETTKILKAAGINYTATESKAPAELLPEPVLNQLQKMNVGDIVQIKEGSNLLMMQLKGSEAAPVDLATAKPAIVNRLKQESMQTVGSDTLEDLKKKAKIEYLQKFDEPAAAASQAVESSKPAANSDKSDNHLKSGLKGL